MIVALFKQSLFQPQKISCDAIDKENNSIHAMTKLKEMTLLHAHTGSAGGQEEMRDLLQTFGQGIPHYPVNQQPWCTTDILEISQPTT